MVYDRELGEIFVQRIVFCITDDEYEYEHEKLVALQVLPKDSALCMTIVFIHDALVAKRINLNDRVKIRRLLDDALESDFPIK